MTERAFVAGDFHLGAGPTDPLEDFDQDGKFAEFVDGIARSDTTLFLNGDFVDFPQIAPFEVPPPSHLLWAEDASTQKLSTAVKAHPECFAALGRFLGEGGKLVVLVGNHDLDLAWPSVQARFAEALGSTGARFTIGGESFKGVWIEHGHEFTPENCPLDPKSFFHEYQAPGRAGPTKYLERVWGTDFMLRFYNGLEQTHPYADAVKPMLTVLWHGLKNGWVGGAELVRLLLFLKSRGLPWKGLVSSVLDAPRAEDVPQLVAASLADDGWKQIVLERLPDASFQAELAGGMEQLLPAEVARIQAGNPVTVDVDPSLGLHSGAPKVLGLFRDDREHRAARGRLQQRGITAVVFGHTHDLVDGAQLSGDLKNRLFNPGTWLPRLDLASAHVQQKIKSEGLTEAMLNDQTLYTAERKSVLIEEVPGHASHVSMIECP